MYGTENREVGRLIQKQLNVHPPSSPPPKVQNQTTALFRGLKIDNHSSVSVIFFQSVVWQICYQHEF